MENRLQELLNKIKPAYEDLIIVLTIILSATLGLGIGLTNSSPNNSNNPAVSIERFDDNLASANSAIKSDNQNQTVYASKNGKKYYYSNCGGLSRIKEENKISFASPTLAESAGFTVASGCEQSN